jgi:hypothetical protein
MVNFITFFKSWFYDYYGINTQFEKDHSELDPRALVDPQTSTGMPPVSVGDQRRIRPSTGVESVDQARTRGMDPDGTSQPEISTRDFYRRFQFPQNI